MGCIKKEMIAAVRVLSFLKLRLQTFGYSRSCKIYTRPKWAVKFCSNFFSRLALEQPTVKWELIMSVLSRKIVAYVSPPPPKIKGYIEILALWITCHIHCKAGMCKGGAAKTVMKMEREKATPSVM